MKALVTGCTLNSALAVMRSMAGEGWSVVGADKRLLPFGLHSRFTPPYELLDNPKSESFTAALNRIIEIHQPDVLIPIGTARYISQASSLLSDSTRFLVPDIEAFDALDDKLLIVNQCEASDVVYPKLLDRSAALRALSSRSVDAVVVKPRKNFGGGTGVSIVREVEAFDNIVSATEERFGETLISEFIPGPDSSNIALQIVFDDRSRPVGHFVQRKLRLHPASVGVSAAGVSEHRPELVDAILPLFSRLNWRGPADVEFKLDSRTGKPCLIEINARFSGAVAFAIDCGVNLPLLACKAALGEVLPESFAPNYRAGQRYWDPIRYGRAVLAQVRSGTELRRLPRQIRAELNGKRVGNPYQLSDPAPFIGKGIQDICKFLSVDPSPKAKEPVRS